MPTRRRRPVPLLLVGLLAGVVLVVLAALVVPALNPFAEREVDRSQPAVLRAVRDLREFRGSSAELQVTVDVERDTPGVPSILKGERTTLLAAGTVDGVIDLSGLGSGAVRLSDDGRSAVLELPRARLSRPRIDPDRTRVLDRDRGVIDRVGSALGDRAVDDQPLYQAAERKLAAAANADPEVRRRAEANARSTLTALLRGLGVERVTVRFVGAPATN